jgi:hypothetical protein
VSSLRAPVSRCAVRVDVAAARSNTKAVNTAGTGAANRGGVPNGTWAVTVRVPALAIGIANPGLTDRRGIARRAGAIAVGISASVAGGIAHARGADQGTGGSRAGSVECWIGVAGIVGYRDVICKGRRAGMSSLVAPIAARAVSIRIAADHDVHGRAKQRLLFRGYDGVVAIGQAQSSMRRCLWKARF